MPRKITPELRKKFEKAKIRAKDKKSKSFYRLLGLAIPADINDISNLSDAISNTPILNAKKAGRRKMEKEVKGMINEFNRLF